MSGGLPGLTSGYVSNDGVSTSVTRTNEFTRSELTNIQTKSDAWGKVIPWGWGRHRVAGALIWASDFYATTSGFDETTTTQNIYTEHSTATGSDAVALGAGFFQSWVQLPPKDISDPPTTQVSHSQTKSSTIDLCYSFGKEGDPRRRRFVDKIRINDTLAFDRSTGFIAPALGFSVRYGWDPTIPELMAKFDDGIYFYKGQDLIIFNQFPTSLYGDAIPNSVDVEFGCCGMTGGETGPTGPTGPTGGTGGTDPEEQAPRLKFFVSGGSMGAASVSYSALNLPVKPGGYIFLVAIESNGGAGGGVPSDFTNNGSTTVGKYKYTLYRRPYDQAFADKVNSAGGSVALFNGHGDDSKDPPERLDDTPYTDIMAVCIDEATAEVLNKVAITGSTKTFPDTVQGNYYVDILLLYTDIMYPYAQGPLSIMNDQGGVTDYANLNNIQTLYSGGSKFGPVHDKIGSRHWSGQDSGFAINIQGTYRGDDI